ncbi:MAG TPA: 4-alpha-glucanotransferase, partial [Spirochaetia bacterium]
MRFPTLDRHFTGVSVPVAALRTDRSCGVGEFADLPALGAWCRSAGLDLIQLLPVNDTGGNSSPYSAVSAFALHPLYLRLDDLPGAAACASELATFRAETAAVESAVTGRKGSGRAAGGRFDYPRVLSFKLGIVERLFDAQEKSIRRDTVFAAWRAANPWCVAHAVFTAARATRDNAPWRTWGGLADPRPEDIAAWWDAHERACLTVAWAQ